jgi:hypothetical protein
MNNSLTSLTGAADSASRRSNAGTVRLTGRDITGLVLCGEMHGAPYDLLAGFLGVREDRLRSIVSRLRKAGYADTGRLGPGPAWLWLTRSGQAITGLGFAPTPPSLARLAHLRAVLAVRLSLEAGDAWEAGQAHWRSERRLRAAMSSRVPSGHVPDGEVSWPDIEGSPYLGDRGGADPQAVSPDRDDHAGTADPDHRLPPRSRPGR